MPVSCSTWAGTTRPWPSSTRSSPSGGSSSATATRPPEPTRHNRARVRRDMGRHDEALAEFDTILTTWREQLGARHQTTLATRHDRARVLHGMGRHDEALAEFDEVAH